MTERRRLTGVVTSDKMTKTVVVQISRTYRHPLYRKVVHAKSKIYAHDEIGCKIGDQVRVVESQPLSHSKRWVVEEIMLRDEAAASPIAEGDLE